MDGTAPAYGSAPASIGAPDHSVPVGPAAPSDGPPSRVRAGAVPFLLGAAAVVIVLVLAGGTSWVVARAVAAEPITAPAASSAPHAAAPKAGGMRQAAVVRGTVRSIDGATWTLATPKGESVRVTVGARTRFVRAGAKAAAGDFHSGETVVVAGIRANGAIDARRIGMPAPHPSASPTAGA